MNSIKKTLFAHCIIIVVYAIFDYKMARYFGAPANVLNFLLFFLLNLLLFYVNAHFIVRYVLKVKAFVVLLIGLILLEMGAYILVYNFLSNIVISGIYSPEVFSLKKYFTMQSLFRGTQFLSLSMFYSWAIYNIEKAKTASRLKLEIAEAERQYVIMENNLLHAQIQRHSILNGLTAIYDHAQDVSEPLADAIFNFAGMMRHSLQMVDPNGKVSIKRELKQVKRIIELYQFRHDNELHVEVNIDCLPEGKDYKILPVVLSTLAENVFQHGITSDPDFPAVFIAGIRGATFLFHTENLIANTNNRTGHQIGLDNIRRRLDYAYGKDYKLTMCEEDNRFVVDLIVPI